MGNRQLLVPAGLQGAYFETTISFQNDTRMLYLRANLESSSRVLKLNPAQSEQVRTSSIGNRDHLNATVVEARMKSIDPQNASHPPAVVRVTKSDHNRPHSQNTPKGTVKGSTNMHQSVVSKTFLSCNARTFQPNRHIMCWGMEIRKKRSRLSGAGKKKGCE